MGLYLMIVARGFGTESLVIPPDEPPWIRDQKTRTWLPAVSRLCHEKMPDDYQLFASSVANWHGEEPPGEPPGIHDQMTCTWQHHEMHLAQLQEIASTMQREATGHDDEEQQRSASLWTKFEGLLVRLSVASKSQQSGLPELAASFNDASACNR